MSASISDQRPQEKSPAPLSTVPKVTTIIRGNIVTPNEIIYGGWLEVKGEEIIRVERGDVAIPDEYVKNATSTTTTSEFKNQESKQNDQQQQQNNQQNKTMMIQIVEAPFVVPGFVDIHNHGLGGIEEVCDHWLVPEYSQRALCRTGTLSVVASLILAADNSKRTNELITAVRPC